MPRRAALLALLALGACGPPTPEAESRTSRVPLTTTADRRAPADSATTMRWIDAHALRFDARHIPDSAVRTIVDDIGDRRMVMLGDTEAGLVEHGKLRLALVRALHEQQGFDVLAIEEPAWECTPVLNPALRYDRSLVHQCPAAAWRRTEELRALLDYVVATQATTRPLVLIGVGVGRSSSRAGVARPAGLASLVAATDSAYADAVFRLDSSHYAARAQSERFLSMYGASPPRPALDSLRVLGRDTAAFDSLARWFLRKAGWDGRSELERARLLFAANVVRSSARTTRLLSMDPGASRAPGSPGRESTITENLVFVADTLYPAQKIIVLSRNPVVRRGSTLAVLAGLRPTVAALLQQQRPAYRAYSLGMHTASSVVRAGGTPSTGRASRMESLEGLFRGADGTALFLVTQTGDGEAGAEFLAARLTTGDEYVCPHVVLRDDYDGIDVVSGATLPTGLRAEGTVPTAVRGSGAADRRSGADGKASSVPETGPGSRHS